MCALSALRRAGGSYGVLVSKLRICRWGLADARWGSTVTGNKLHLHALRPVDSEKSFVPGRGVSYMLPGWRVYGRAAETFCTLRRVCSSWGGSYGRDCVGRAGCRR